MKRIEIKKFFKLLEQGKKAYPQLQKFLEEVDRFILAIIQTVLTFLNSFLNGLKDQNDDEEKQVFEKDMLFATLDTFSRKINAYGKSFIF